VRIAARLAAALSLFAGIGCGAIEQRVMPVSADVTVGTIYVVDSGRLHMKKFPSEVVGILQDLGYDARLVEGVAPPDAVYRMEMTARWGWDLAMYLMTLRMNLFELDAVIGSIDYDAASSTLSKFGSDTEKITPLLREMLRNTHARKDAP
jgi:hypothetical protein